MQYMSGWRRFFAILIDSIVLFILFVIIGILTGNAKGGSIQLNGAPAGIYFLLDFLYFIVLEGLFSATLGKMATGIKVVYADGSKLTWKGAVIRNVLRIADGFPYFIPYLVGAIVMWSSGKKQRVGDLAAGTVVVPKDAAVPSGIGAS